MIFPEVNFEDWEKKTNLVCIDYECPKCKKTFKTDVPVITKDSFGWMSPIHECGQGYWTGILRPRTQEAKEFWEEIV